MSDPNRRNLETDAYALAVSQRCVCGKEVRIVPAMGGLCESCGYHFAPFKQNESLTATLDFSASPTPSQTHHQELPSSPPVSERFGHYRLVNALGQGGMGTVYRAFDESLQRYVALKVIQSPTDQPAKTQNTQRLLQEAVSQARVNHPNIVHIYFVGVENDSPFFAMELVNGQTLKQRLQNGPIPFSELISSAQQIVSALQHAAELDILHGDIKPGNILLTNASVVKLADFGLARRLSEISSDEGRITGTPDYLSPEAIVAKPLDVRSDMYSLGVTFFEMTFNRLPYTCSGSGVMERLRAHQEQAVAFPAPWPEKIPLAWRSVLAKLLCKDPAGRYHTYHELMHDLVQLTPVTLHPGGLGPRSLAWFVDMGLANTTVQLLTVPLTSGLATTSWVSQPVLQLTAALVGIIVLLLIALLQSYWGKTPGKKLFQLRIVDRHGLAVQKPLLFGRMLFQLLPLWAGILYQICSAFGAIFLGQILSGITLAITLLDLVWAIFHKRRRCLHDFLFRTRVVLDTQPSAIRSSSPIIS